MDMIMKVDSQLEELWYLKDEINKLRLKWKKADDIFKKEKVERIGKKMKKVYDSKSISWKKELLEKEKDPIVKNIIKYLL